MPLPPWLNFGSFAGGRRARRSGSGCGWDPVRARAISRAASGYSRQYRSYAACLAFRRLPGSIAGSRTRRFE
jgi:hypothetical protein